VENLWKNRFIHRLKRRYIDENAASLIGLPWQTNITLIIRFFLSDLLCIAVFCAVYRGLFFLLPIWQNGAKTTKRGKF
jgi:hypothetical protein